MKSKQKLGHYQLLLLALLIAALAAIPAEGALEIVQERVSLETDYLLFTAEDQSTIEVQGTITVRNTEAEDLTVETALSGLPSGYSAAAIENLTIAAGNSSDISFTVNIPHIESSGERQIGTLTVSSGSFTDSAALIQNTSTMLVLDEIKVSYREEDDDSDENTFSKENEFTLRKDVKAATEMIFTVRVENMFSKQYDDDESTFEDIVLTVEADDNDIFPDEFQEEYDIGELEAEKEDKIDFRFTLPDELDEGDYTITFTLEGDDGTGAVHRDEKDLHFTVIRARDDIRITDVKAMPAIVSLCDPRATIDVRLRNLGTDDQRRAAIALFNEQLGINELRQNIILDEFDRRNDERTEQFIFEFNPELSSGSYPLDITAFINTDERMDIERLMLNIAACEEPSAAVSASGNTETEEEEQEGEQQENETNERNETEEMAGEAAEGSPGASASKISSAVVVDTTENPFTASDIIIIAMIAAVVLLLGLITFLVLMLFK